jgi:hypothetical protein
MTWPDNDDQVRPQLTSLILHQLRHFGAPDIILQLVSVSPNPTFDRSLVELVLSGKFELKNIGELVIAQGGCFGELTRVYPTGNSYIQIVNSKEFPFGNYQFSGTWD